MQFPNVASLAVIAALVAALEFIVAGAEGVSDAWWIPAIVLVLGAIAKALQVYLQQARDNARGLDVVPPSKVRRWLLG
jgi:hypothetical protein